MIMSMIRTRDIMMMNRDEYVPLVVLDFHVVGSVMKQFTPPPDEPLCHCKL